MKTRLHFLILSVILGSVCLIGVTEVPTCEPAPSDCVEDFKGECTPLEEGCTGEDIIIFPNSCERGLVCCGPLNPEDLPF